MSDGLYFYNGKIIGETKWRATWQRYQKAWTRLYNKSLKLEARLRKERAKIDALFNAHYERKPYTPWIGNAEDGADEKFLAEAKRVTAIRKRSR